MNTELQSIYYKIFGSSGNLYQASQPLKRTVLIMLQINLNNEQPKLKSLDNNYAKNQLRHTITMIRMTVVNSLTKIYMMNNNK